jgi:hypothetical protein
MPINAMVDPNAFRWGARFSEGRDSARQDQRQNALLDMHSKRFGMDEQRFGMEQQEFEQGQQERAATMQSEQSEAQLNNAYKLYISGNRDAFRTIAELEGLDEEDLNGLDVDKFVQVNAQMRGISQKPEKTQYQRVGNDLLEMTDEGPSLAYRAPQAPQPAAQGSWGSPFEADVGGQRGLYRQHSVTGEIQPVNVGGQVASKPTSGAQLPIGALTVVDDAMQAIAATTDSQVLVDGAIAMLEGGKVKLGAVANVKSNVRNMAGKSDDNSRAYASLIQSFEKLRNNYMLLAKGVQTDKDAERAWASEIGENVQRDNALALQQMLKAQAMIDRAIAAQNTRIKSVYGNYGQQVPNAPASGDTPADDPLGLR